MNVLMPQLGETVAEGTVATWHKSVGDRVEADEILLDVETDKVSMEIPAPGAGRIKEILVAAGQTVDVGTVLAVIETAADSTAAGVGSDDSQSAAVAAGSAAEPVAVAPASAPAVPPAAARSQGTSGSAAGTAPLARQEHLKLSPAVRRLLAESGLDAGAIEGTGRGGRVTRRDVLAQLERGETDAPAPRPAASVSVAQFPSRSARVTDGATHEPFNRVRRLTAEHMIRSKATSPHVLQAIEVDFSAVERTRQAARESWRNRHGYSLTFLPFVAHAVCRALREFPHANASVEDDGLLLHASVNLAIAVDLGPGGLVAPVVQAAETLSFSSLAEAMHDVAERARDNRLAPDDFAGGTYTLSNSGTFGTLITAPIINQPQVAILSIDGIRKRPVVVEHDGGDAIAIRPIGVLAQSFDHRAMDGAYSAAFLARLRGLIEDTDWGRSL